MPNRISLRVYLFIFFALVGLLPESLFDLSNVLSDAKLQTWPIEFAFILVLSYFFAWLIARPFQRLVRNVRQMDQHEITPPSLLFGRFAPTEAQELAGALSEVAQRQADAKSILEERVAARTAELAFSRDLLFKQNIELENLNNAMTQRSRENQQLLIETLYRSQELTVLNEMSSEVLAARSFNDLHPRALELATKMLEAPIGLIGLLDDKNEKWYGSEAVDPYFASTWQQVSTENSPITASLLARETLKKGTLLAIEDISRLDYTEEPLLQLTGLQSVVFLPLYSPEDKKPLGVLVLGDLKSRQWRPDEIELMSTVANHLALSLSYARLMDEIANERNRFNAVLNGVSDGVVLVNEHSRLLFANPAALRNMGLPEKAVLSDYDPDLFLPVSIAQSQQLVAQLAQGEVVEPVQVERNGRTWGVSINPIYDKTNQFIGVAQVQRDITEAARVDRMKTEFISLVSHELRTPLTSIKGYVELVLDGDTGPINELQHRFLETARNSSDRLVSLINDLLDVSRIESGKIQLEQGLLYLKRSIHSVIEALHLTAEQRDLHFHLTFPPELPPAWADRDRVTQILTNLISNAVKYSRQGGEIGVTARQSADQQFLEIEVQDNGIGMTEEEQKQLFSQFFRSSNPAVRSISGTGLGLTITKSLVEMHGGQIWVESKLGVGSTFGFSLPVAPLSETERSSDNYPSQEAFSGKPKIMVLDVELSVAELLRYHLEIEGYEVGLALDNEEVLLRVAMEQPEMIVLLPGLREPETCQLNLPLLQRIKYNEPTREIPVVLLSIMQESRHSFRLRALVYLAPPILEKEVVKQFHSLLGEEWSFEQTTDEDELESGLVLVANDDPSTRFKLDQTLQTFGYTTLLAANGAQALTLARRHQPDLILLDLNILEYEGLSVLHTLKNQSSSTAILVMASIDQASDSTDSGLSLMLGTVDFPDESFSLEELATRIAGCGPVSVSYG
ncbi:MAG: ATP-binding protein [Chloroflexota bacterium]|nr:response regulator [Chloroflexota bacterium]